MHKLGHTRSTNQRDHLLHTPDTRAPLILRAFLNSYSFNKIGRPAAQARAWQAGAPGDAIRGRRRGPPAR